MGNTTGRPYPVGTQTPYNPWPYSVAPDYRFSGTVPVGIRPAAWQGVQKINGIAQMGTLWARYEYLNLTASRTTTQFVNQINPMTRYVGPGIANAPYQAQQATISANSGQKTSLGQRILARLTGG